MKHFMIRLLICSLVVAHLSACDKDFLSNPEVKIPVAPLPVMSDYLKYNYSFSMLYGALERSGLLQQLSDTSKPFTLLAPDNAAFAKAGITDDSLNKMDPAYLKQWLSYHLLTGKLAYDGIPAKLNNKYTSISEQPLYISKSTKGGSAVNSVKMLSFGTTRDIPVYNGVVYVLESTLQLPAANIKEILTTNLLYSRFGKALAKFGLLDKLGGPGSFVVLAVDNNRFMSESELSAIDTTTYKQYLFGSHIMEDRFFFHTDFQYRSVPANSSDNQYYVGSDGVLVISYDAYFFAVPLNAGPNPPSWMWALGDEFGLEFPPSKTLLALNGMVIDCPGSLVYPYNMMK